MENIAVAIIAAIASILASVISLVGVIISNSRTNEQYKKQLEISQAVMKNDIEELTREVREHNNFAHRMPVVEAEIQMIKEKLSHVGG